MSYDFIKTFKYCVKLCCYGGSHIPGTEKLFRYPNFFKFFFNLNFYLAQFFLNTLTVEELYNALYNDELAPSEKVFFLFGCVSVETTALRLLVMKMKRQELLECMEQWNNSFKQPLFPKWREDELIIMQKRIVKLAKYQVLILVLPIVAWSLSPLIIGKELSSNGFPGDHDKSPTFELIFLFHVFFAWYMSAGWVSFDVFFFLLMGTILIELNHLSRSLKEIFNIIQSDLNGKIYVRDGSQKSEINSVINDQEDEESSGGNFRLYHERVDEARKLLRMWVIHYTELISYSDRVQKFYAPVITLQFFYLTALGCGMFYAAVTGKVEMQNALGASTFYSSTYLITYILCQYGNKITDKSLDLTQEAFGQDWALYPRDIKRSLIIIMIITTKKPIRIHAFGVVKWNVKAFKKLLQLTYTFITFMAQVQSQAK